MELREFFSEDAIKLDLESTAKDDILNELISLLKLDEKSEGMLFKMLKRRENLGSTGIGRGIAIPHCRSLVVTKLRVAFGRKPGGVDFKAIDEKPVYFFFLIVAPPLEVSNQYLPVLGKIAQFSKEADVPERLLALTEPKQFLALLEEKAGIGRIVRDAVSRFGTVRSVTALADRDCSRGNGGVSSHGERDTHGE